MGRFLNSQNEVLYDRDHDPIIEVDDRVYPDDDEVCEALREGESTIA